MQLIAVTMFDERWDACLQVYPDAIPFAATRGSKELTHQRLARFAVEVALDLDTLIIQDDVRFQGPIPPVPDRFTVYGFRRRPDHTCPQAYRADLKTWEHLAERWDGRQACKAWEPLVHHLEVSNIAAELVPAVPPVGRNAPCLGCRH